LRSGLTCGGIRRPGMNPLHQFVAGIGAAPFFDLGEHSAIECEKRDEVRPPLAPGKIAQTTPIDVPMHVVIPSASLKTGRRLSVQNRPTRNGLRHYERTIVPIATFGYGLGATSGGRDGENVGGGAGGGGVGARRVGYIEISSAGARYVSISTFRNVVIAALASIATGLCWDVCAVRPYRLLFGPNSVSGTGAFSNSSVNIVTTTWSRIEEPFRAARRQPPALFATVCFQKDAWMR